MDNNVFYTKEKLERIEKITKKINNISCIFLVICSILFIIMAFFVNRYVQWYDDTFKVSYDFIDNEQVDKYDYYASPNLKNVYAYDQYFNFVGDVYIDINY